MFVFSSNELIKKSVKVVFYTALALFSVNASAQTEAQIKSELEKRGIDTYEEVQAELRKRGMSEADARRQARLYGIDYDEYLSKYILSKQSSTEVNSNAISKVDIDTVDYLIETSNVQDQIATGLPYFGYETFNNNPFANQQALVSNIDPGYIIGPGDELRIYLWGEAEFQFEGKVDINGNLFIPNVGQVFVSGTSYQNLNQRLKQYLSKFYSGLSKTPQKIFLDVSLSKLRPIRIMVMGESNNPGSHIVNSFATTVNSLYASGGIKRSGSLREIKVFRNNRLTSTIDLYDYLIKGAVAEDMRLVSNDVIFIQSRLNTVTLQGEVNKEAIYELKNNEGLVDLISFAGGLKPSAYTESVTIKRIKSLVNRQADNAFDREIITINYNELLSNGINFRIQDGDIIEFGTVLDKVDNAVTISGSIFRPGDYQLEPNMTLKDLIQKSGGLRPNTYLEKLDLFRRDRNGQLKFQSISLKELMAEGPGSNYLQADDSIKVYNESELKTLETVSIEGFLSEPKTILWREDLSLYDLIFMSANVEDLEYQSRILTSRADLLRFQEGLTQYRTIPFDLDSVLDKKFNAVLKPKDRVILYSRDITEQLDLYATIVGAVKNSGRFSLSDSMTVEDLILQSGGFLRKSFTDSVTVTSESFDFSGNKIAEAKRIKVDLDYLTGKAKKNKSSYFLKDNDFVSVDLIPGSDEQRAVTLSGESILGHII